MALYELKSHELSEFHMQSDEKGFVATVRVDGKDFSGRGISKIVAKNDASEKALRDLIITKMQTIPKGSQSAKSSAGGGGGGGGSNDDDDPMDGDESVGGGNDDDVPEEVPMMHLASFALHKLFTEWQADGYEIPDFKVPGPAVVKPVSEQHSVAVCTRRRQRRDLGTAFIINMQ